MSEYISLDEANKILLKNELHKLNSTLDTLVDNKTHVYDSVSSRVFQGIGRCEAMAEVLGYSSLKDSLDTLAASLYNLYDGINYEGALTDLKSNRILMMASFRSDSKKEEF